MKNLRIISYISLIAAMILIVGCAPSKPRPGEVAPKPEEVSGPKPGWVTDDRASWTDEEKVGDSKEPIYVFKVLLRDEADLQLAFDGLDGEAYTAMINAVKNRAGQEFDEAIKGSPAKAETIGKVRQRVVNSAGEAKFAGLRQRNHYWEKWKRYETGNRVSYFYNLWALYLVPEEEYQMAKDRAWNETAKGLSGVDKDAEQLMNEVKQRFLSRE